MKTRSFLLGSGLLLLATVVAGCATDSTERTTTPAAAVSTDPGNLAFHYRLQAAELRATAQRLEFEAEWYAKQGGQGSEQAKRSQEMAKEMRVAADEAEQLAREYRSQLPHNQVY
jgi:hypothetical protein